MRHPRFDPAQTAPASRGINAHNLGCFTLVARHRHGFPAMTRNVADEASQEITQDELFESIDFDPAHLVFSWLGF